MKRTQGLDEREIELVKLLMADCQTTGDIQAKLKRLFAGTIEQMLEAEMDEHLGYEKNSVAGNNSGNSRNGTVNRPSLVITASARSQFRATEMVNLSQKLSKSDRHEPTRSNKKSCRCMLRECRSVTSKIC